MESPEKLRDLDLDAFAEELERQVIFLLFGDQNHQIKIFTSYVSIKMFNIIHSILYVFFRVLVKSELPFMT